MGKKDKSHQYDADPENDDMKSEEQPHSAENDPVDEQLYGIESEARIAELEQSLAELRDKQLRLLAEFENYKKRSMKERGDLVSFASKDVLMSLLPVLDDFDRAKKSADNPNTDEQFSEGVSMVYSRLYNVLQSQGLTVMESTGQPFDPEWHDAITEIPAPTPEMKGRVIDTIEKGYLLHDKIIRHAKVVVGN
jgi:molecular chaperone GrpE